MKGHRVGFTTNMPGDNGDGAELAHGARITKQHAVEQSPFDVWQGYSEESRDAGSAKRECRFFLRCALFLHERNEFAGDKGKRDEQRCEHNSGKCENDLDPMRSEPWSRQTLQSEKKNEHKTGDDRRYGERQIDQGDQERLAWKPKLRDRPSCGKTEKQVQRDRRDRNDKRETDRGQRVRVRQGG